jgi:hypothetical protein
MRLRFVVPLLGLVTCSLLAAACNGDGGDDEAEGGAGGQASSPTPGAGGDTSAAGDTAAGGDCATNGSGTLVVEVTGLPDGVAPDIDIAGPDELNATETGPFEGVAAGSYTITADRVFDDDPIVRTVYDAKVVTPSLCLSDGGSSTIQVQYTAIPTSNKLWMPTGLDEEGAGFTSAKLAASATTAASVSVDGGVGKSVAFDRDGNLWTLGPTLDFPHVLRFAAASLAASGQKEPDISFNVPEVECLPAMRTLAFDAGGNLWLSTCGDWVLRIPRDDLNGVGGEKVSDVLIAGATDAEGIAFDLAGNLWVAGGATLARYDAARLGESTGDAPDLELNVKDELAGLKASYITFDKAGNLWGTDFAANAVFQIAAADLEGTGTKEIDANVSITLGVTALLHQPAFDEGNGLWLGLDDGRIGRLGPAQLGVSAGPGAPATPEVLLKSASVGAELPLAFFPAPQGLPLYHSIPAE